MRKPFVWLGLAVLILSLLAACGGQAQTGTLQFRANGEDFVRQGFVSKDGWAITFDHVYVTLADVAAYQTDPPFDSESGEEVQADATASLAGTHTIDLAAGDEEAEPILVGEVSGAAAGQYNALAWRMIHAPEGDAEGYTLVVVGTAEKDGETVNFTLRVETEYAYVCGEFVGDERKGLLAADGSADVEMTFHFDHVFGDADTPPDDALNRGAVGFDSFAALAQDGVLDVDMAALQGALSTEDYQTLVETLPTLGHVGEGHCHEVQ